MMTRRKAGAAVVLFVGAAVLVAAWATVGTGPHPIDWHRLDAPDSITVELTTGPIAWTRVTDVTETPTTVRVTVKSTDLSLGPGTSVGDRRQLSIHLAQPLGNRLVYDGTGQEVPLYQP